MPIGSSVIRLALVDDHELIRDSFDRIIKNGEVGYRVTLKSANGEFMLVDIQGDDFMIIVVRDCTKGAVNPKSTRDDNNKYV